MLLVIKTNRTKKTTKIYLVNNEYINLFLATYNMGCVDGDLQDSNWEVECCQDSPKGNTCIITPYPVKTDPRPGPLESRSSQVCWAVNQSRQLIDRVTDEPIIGLQFEVLVQYFLDDQFEYIRIK